MASRRPGSRSFSQWSETGAVSVADQVDDWLAIDPEGDVTVFSGKVELGTGVQTALAQIVAEELDVPFDRIHMVMGDTELTPNEGITAGSTTIQFGGFALRMASAEARLALLEMAADRLDANVEELSVREGIVTVTADPVRTISYGELIGGRPFNRTISLKAPVKPPNSYRVIGQPLQRSDIPAKLTGQTSYVHDVRLPGMLHARLVRPPSPGAHLISFDRGSAADVQIVRVGDFLAVAAEREEAAVRGAEALKAEWQETAHLPPFGKLDDFLRSQKTSDRVVFEEGYPDSAIHSGQRTIAANYSQPFQAHASIGPSCSVADVHSDRATVWSSTQGPYPLRESLADLLAMPEEAVRVIYAEGSGSYGHNGADDAAADAALISKELGRPVRLQWSRRDEFLWEPYAPAMVMELRGSLDEDGAIAAWTHDVWSPSHAGRPRSAGQLLAGQLAFGLQPPKIEWYGGGDRNAPVDYDVPYQKVTAHWLQEEPLRTSSMRTLGAFANVFANESFMDELAAEAGAGPVEFRLRHLKDPRAIAVLKSAAERAGWASSLPPGTGRGVAFAQYENQVAYVATVAEVEVDPASGAVQVRRLVSAHDCGLIINPDGLSNQVEGNLIQSLSRALFEQVTFDESRITSADWDTYPILKFSDVPEVEVVLIDHPEEPAVGAGEPASICTAPAVANAIFAACGARVRQVPFTMDRIMASLEGV